MDPFILALGKIATAMLGWLAVAIYDRIERRNEKRRGEDLVDHHGLNDEQRRPVLPGGVCLIGFEGVYAVTAKTLRFLKGCPVLCCRASRVGIPRRKLTKHYLKT